jgi:putative membrane protein
MSVSNGADSFLGAQGYVWDTQTDMMLALIGAMIAVLFLSTSQNTSIQKIKA